jgi:hypothetical protein|tara:strand:+ start:372 stop:710 length:339 start_codon:yes stop_codon:yes gene_type:complete
MSADLAAKLRTEVSKVGWAPLVKHHKREALWLINETVSIVDVGVALAENDSKSISDWLKRGLMRKPEDIEVEAWEAAPLSQHFEFLILQPFVIAAEIEGPEPVSEPDDSHVN